MYTFGFDSIFNEFYTRSITLFYTASVVHLVGLRFFPADIISMSDILGVIYYGTGFVAVMLESFTLRLSSLTRRILLYGIICACMAGFSRLSFLTYGGEKMYREQCEASRIDMDCIHFPHLHAPQLADTIDGSTRNSTATNTVYVGLAGQIQPFSYIQGQEAEADQHIANLKQQSFAQEAQKASGIYRFHRVVPTPAVSPEEAIQWAKQVYDVAVQRAEKAKEQAVEEKKQKKNKKKKNKKKKVAQVDGAPIINQA
jgi:hypothetical protein